jgi:hypothetical protein
MTEEAGPSIQMGEIMPTASREFSAVKMRAGALAGIAVAIVGLVSAGGAVDAQMRNPPGPPSFAMLDANGDGYVTRAEFEAFREKRMKMMAAQGRPMRNAGRGTPFSALDANGDGRISKKEFESHRAMHMRRMRSGQGRNQP